VVGIARDISLLKKAEEVLKRDKEGLKKLVNERSRELLRAQEDLDKAKHLSELGLLAATVAHELRTPLAAIRTAAYNIDKKCPDPAIDSHIENIEKKVAESDQIIKNLLGYSSIKVPYYETVDVCALLEECLSLSKEIFHTYKVSVRKVFMCRDRCAIEADPVQLKEVFSNILHNAYESFKNRKGKLEIRGRLLNGYLKVSFKDNGCGIPVKYVGRVTEPFFTTKAKGMGLGLAICRQIIDLHKGSLDIEKARGKGTIVTVAFPVKWSP
jgi:signal transduction histidine kinase